MLPSKDINFVGYTYKNYEIVDENVIPGIGKFISLSLSLSII
jgi:serine/threonine kinase 38